MEVTYSKKELGFSDVDIRVLRAFNNGGFKRTEISNISKEEFDNSLDNIRQILWGLFPKLKHKDPIVYDRKTKKYQSLFKVNKG